MIYTVVYTVEATSQFCDSLRQTNLEMFECLVGPFAWTAKESASSMEDLPTERLARFKTLYLHWILRTYSSLAKAAICSRLSQETFDEFWTVRRIVVEGDIADLRGGAA